MKKIIILLVLIMLVSPGINAEESKTNNKIKADSSFYFLDKAEERISLFFSSDKEKAKLKLKHGYERLIEAKEMIKKDNFDRAKELTAKGVKNFSEATQLATKDLISEEEWQKIKGKFQDALAELNHKITKTEITDKIKSIFDFDSTEPK